MKREERDRFTGLLDDRYFNVIVSASDSRSELRMKVRTHQVRIAAAELLPPYTMAG
jgi:hypothetical protein